MKRRLKIAGLVVGALVLLVSFPLYLEIRHRYARSEYVAAAGHMRAGQWADAIVCLEKAKEWGFPKIEDDGECDLMLADACMRVGRYKEALDAAYRSRQIAEMFGDGGDPGPYRMMAKALSYRYAQTGKVRFLTDGCKHLALYMQKALARGIPPGIIAVRCEGARHRLGTGKLVTDEEYLRKQYPSEGNKGPLPTGEPPKLGWLQRGRRKRVSLVGLFGIPCFMLAIALLLLGSALVISAVSGEDLIFIDTKWGRATKLAVAAGSWMLGALLVFLGNLLFPLI